MTRNDRCLRFIFLLYCLFLTPCASPQFLLYYILEFTNTQDLQLSPFSKSTQCEWVSWGFTSCISALGRPIRTARDHGNEANRMKRSCNMGDRESNPGPRGYKPSALPTELGSRPFIRNVPAWITSNTGSVSLYSLRGTHHLGHFQHVFKTNYKL